MPTGGGTFTTQNKILPGAYINFVALGSVPKVGARGVAALPLELDWGPENRVFALEAAEFNQVAMKVLGHDPIAAELLLIREALKRTKTLLVYRVNSGGQKATASVGGMTVTAAWGGTRGNDLSVAVLSNADNAANVDVVTYLDGAAVDTQTVAKSAGTAGLKANNYVSYGTAATLSGGSRNSADRWHKRDSQWCCPRGSAGSLRGGNLPGDRLSRNRRNRQGPVCGLCEALRDDEGKKISGVLYQHSGDYMGLINVKNGVVLADGTTVTGDKAVAWVTGATARRRNQRELDQYRL